MLTKYPVPKKRMASTRMIWEPASVQRVPSARRNTWSAWNISPMRLKHFELLQVLTAIGPKKSVFTSLLHLFHMCSLWHEMSIFPPENLLSSTWQGWSVESCRRLIHPAGNNNENNWIWSRENICMKQASAWLQSPPQVVSHWSNPHSSAFQTEIFMLRWCISFHTIAVFHLVQFLSRSISDKKTFK